MTPIEKFFKSEQALSYFLELSHTLMHFQNGKGDRITLTKIYPVDDEGELDMSPVDYFHVRYEVKENSFRKFIYYQPKSFYYLHFGHSDCLGTKFFMKFYQFIKETQKCRTKS